MYLFIILISTFQVHKVFVASIYMDHVSTLSTHAQLTQFQIVGNSYFILIAVGALRLYCMYLQEC